MSTGTVHPFPDPALGNASYLVDAGSGLAVAVDPPRDVEAHLQRADELGLRIVCVLETHLHADFVSGSRELAEAVGAEVVASDGAELAFGHRPVRDGSEVRIGDLSVGVLTTPGHTPEHVSFHVQGAADEAIFTGGALIDGGVARTDLIAPDATEDLARAQFRTLRRLATFPDHTAVHPTHGPGSFCSAAPRSGAGGTLGQLRRATPLFSISDEDEFVRTLVDGYGSFPPYFLCLRAVNQRGPALVADLPPVRRLAPLEAAEAVEAGAWFIDGRTTTRWAEEHPVGAVSIEVRPAFASWLGWVVPFGAPVVLMVDPDQVGEAVRQARRIGYDRLIGWVPGDLRDWREAGLPTASAELVEPAEASERGWDFVDVRQRSEWSGDRIPGAVQMELGDLIAGAVPSSGPVVTYCGHGERSATAASLLERRGVRVANLAGGIGAWTDAGLPIER